MDFKTFLRKNLLLTFCISATCICLAMAVVGLSFQPDAQFGYEVFFSPLFFAGLATLPSLVHYSSRELTLKQSLIRQLIHFLLLELVILSILYSVGQITSLAAGLALAAAIFVIDLIVNLILWINDKKTAGEINEALKILQND